MRANQRARLRGAMIEAVAEHGYEATSVRRLRALAGVSEKTVYDLFPSKQAYFLDTYDFVVRGAAGRIAAAYRGTGERDRSAGLCRALDAFAEEVARRPKAARLALVEALVAGPAALERIGRGEALFERMIARSLERSPAGVELSPVLLKGIVGGVWHAARTRLLQERPAAMHGSGRELSEWVLSYRSPAARLLDGAAARPDGPARHLPGGGRETGTARIDGGERMRMLRAAAQIAARGGYQGLTSGQIAERAGVEPERLFQLFSSVEGCFLASLELLSVQALTGALRESEGAPDWPASVCRAVGALMRHIAGDPALARVAFVEALAAGPAGVERGAALMRSFAELLARRAPRSRRPAPLVAEAIVGAVWAMVRRHVAHGRARALPALAGHVAYVVLAPIVGAEAAVEAILAERAAGTGRRAEPAPASRRPARPAAAAPYRVRLLAST